MDPAGAAEGVQVTERWAGRLNTLLRSNSMNTNGSAANAEIQHSPGALAAAVAAAQAVSTVDAGSSATAAAIATDAGTSAQATNEAHNPFNQYYAQIIHQQNMLQDSVRTGIYQRAVLENADDFRLVAVAL
jgi:hypothetical protein